MKRSLLITLSLISFLSFCSAQKSSSKEILGSYSLKRIDYIYTDTTVVVNPSQSGFLILSKERYAIAYNPGLNPRQPFKNLSAPTDEESLTGFKTFAFNSGSFVYEESILTAKPDFAKVPGFEGGEQVYEVNISKELTSLTMFDETYPDGTKPSWYGKLKIKLYFEKE